MSTCSDFWEKLWLKASATKKVDNHNIDDLAEASINVNIKEENVFLFALFSGLSGGIFDKEVAANTLDAIRTSTRY